MVNEFNTVQRVESVRVLADLTPDISALVHDLQAVVSSFFDRVKAAQALLENR